jgi:hypothetical protein
MSIATARINADVSIERDRTNAAMFASAGRANVDIAGQGFGALTRGIDSLAARVSQPITYNVTGGVFANDSVVSDVVIGSGRNKTNCTAQGGPAGNAGNAGASANAAVATPPAVPVAPTVPATSGAGGASGQTQNAC